MPTTTPATSRPKIEEEDRPDGDTDQHLHAHPVGHAQVARIARHGEPSLGVLGRGRAAESRAHPRQSADQRAQGALAERLLEFEFLEVLGLDRAKLRETGLDRVDRRVGRKTDEEQKDAAGDENANDDSEHLSDLDGDDASDRDEPDEHQEAAERQDDHAGG